jgi:hypothetical protein
LRSSGNVKTNANLTPLNSLTFIPIRKLKGDAQHPNAEVHARLAEKIFKELQSI